MFYVIAGIVAVILLGLFVKYKKYNRMADKFQETYPDAEENKQ